jgi:hypothetical protein
MSTTAADKPTNGAAIVPTDPNPFGTRRAPSNAAVEVESQRAIAETQAAMVIAQRFPRDPVVGMDRILQAFTRTTLAEKALYTYARGGTDITGPSIRAAEAIAQDWGNMQFGIRELEQRSGESTVEAFAWDVERNTRSTKVFQVKHIRHTKKGQYRLEDPRDIYELVANQGARRLRACILSIIPGDVIEAAVKQAEKTLQTKVELTPEKIQSMLDMFGSIGVSRRMLEAKIQRRIEAITPALVVQLGKIYNSIEDGMSGVQDHFEIEEQAADDASGKSRTDALADKLKARQKPEAAAPPAEQEKVAPAAEQIDDKSVRAELRTKIAKLWEHLPLKKREAILKAEYPKQNSIIDLATDQLIEFHDKLPELLTQGEEE